MTGDKQRRSETAVKRRKYLLGIGTALTVSLAGCPASSDTGDESTTGTTKVPPTESASPTPRAETTTETTTPTPTPTATEQSPTPTTTPEEPGDAKQLIREFYAAADTGNFQQANSLVHPDSPEGTISETQQQIFEKQEIDIQAMTVVDERTDRTTVQTTLVFTRDGRERTRTRDLELRTHDGAWRLYSVN